MTDRTTTLRDLADQLSDHDLIEDAWLAKSFTDQILVIDVTPDQSLPADIETPLPDHDLVGANEVYGTAGPDTSFMGTLDEANRHQFVDVRTRGDHQSYVIE